MLRAYRKSTRSLDCWCPKQENLDKAKEVLAQKNVTHNLATEQDKLVGPKLVQIAGNNLDLAKEKVAVNKMLEQAKRRPWKLLNAEPNLS